MIVSPAISQKNYIIGNDTVVGYTKKENRTIAIIFQDRNKLEELNFDNEIIIDTYKVNQFKLEDNLKQYSIKDSINTSEKNRLNNELDSEIKSKELWKIVGTGGVVSTVILLITQLLK